MQFLEIIRAWVNRYFSNEEAVLLVVVLALGFGLVLLFGGSLAPVLAGLVFAFLLQGLVRQLVAWRVPEPAAVWLTFLLFLGGLTGAVLVLAPLIWQQMIALSQGLPALVERVAEVMNMATQAFPALAEQEALQTWLEEPLRQLGQLSISTLEAVVTNAPSLVWVLVYLVLTPISVFFFLRDRRRIVGWVTGFLPAQRPLMQGIGAEMNQQLANYVRGKFVEILIVAAVTWLAFTLLGLNYAALLGLLVGISVLVPFVGAAVVALPVALVGVLQFGWSWDLAWVMLVYALIQALDGNVLVPLLFSEAVDLHPVLIIVAVLVFGGIWGVWGVFFAIPLATLLKAIHNAWPRQPIGEHETDGS